MEFRKGMWVTFGVGTGPFEGRVGILVEPSVTVVVSVEPTPENPDGLEERTGAEVHVIAEDGTTEHVVKALPLEMIRQAKWTEVPASRRQISDEKAASLGY